MPFHPSGGPSPPSLNVKPPAKTAIWKARWKYELSAWCDSGPFTIMVLLGVPRADTLNQLTELVEELKKCGDNR